MSLRCLTTEGKNYKQNKQFVEDTLKYFPDYDFNVMKATISGWQSSQLKDNEDRLPTIQELIDYLQNSAKRENNNNIKIIADKAQQILNNLSTYNGKLQDILANAPRDSQGRLLAPNGKPSNLTERQYAQVRTKEFKDWFGDWENDPTNASKVVDENGEPLVVYHRSDTKNLSIFDISKAKKEDRILAFAYHFGTEKAADEIDLYGSNVSSKYAVFLNIKNEFKWTDLAQGDFIRALRNLNNNDIISDEEFDKFRDYKYTKSAKERLNLMKSLFTRMNKDGYSYINNVEDRGSKSWAVFNPNQIKSATDNIGTFSTIDNDIRRSSITEHTAKVASISTFTDRLPVPQQAKFAAMVSQGDVKISCMQYCSSDKIKSLKSTKNILQLI